MPSTSTGKRSISKLGAQVSFSPHKCPALHMGPATYLLSLSVTPQDEWRLHEYTEKRLEGMNGRGETLAQQLPEIWAEGNPPGLAKHHTPIITQLNPVPPGLEMPASIAPEARLGILPHINRLKQAGILINANQNGIHQSYQLKRKGDRTIGQYKI